jgi:hypothetical protein
MRICRQYDFIEVVRVYENNQAREQTNATPTTIVHGALHQTARQLIISTGKYGQWRHKQPHARLSAK